PTGLTVVRAGATQSFVVRSNRPWQIVKKSEADWVKTFPDEGEDDGIFKIIVSENQGFDTRTMNFAFVVDGNEEPVLFRVDQEANVPYITAPAAISIPAVGGDFTVDVTSNVTWTYTLADESWLTEQSVTSTKINLSAAINNNPLRSTTMTITATNYPTVTATVTLNQSPGSVVLEENFSWLAYGNAVFYTTTGETRIDNWTQEQKDKGWTSTINTTPLSGNTPLVYARQGFVKLGKTGYGGDLISPVLSGISGTQNLTVTFKAVPYQTAGGTKDDNILNVSVIGPGTVSQGQFIIDNWPVYPAENVLDYCIGMWNEPAASRTFTITGATSETQIKFLGGEYYLVGVGVGKNRIFLDDIKVEILP
ncbi:MAG TPA: BACON domain-containing protein, partial [Bacteroidales bacterium]|nr:BACON domain-containing protein [Bacteroidales bacterium]